MCFFFLNDTATTEIYTLSLHDALPISVARAGPGDQFVASAGDPVGHRPGLPRRSEQVLLTHDDEGGGGDAAEPDVRPRDPFRPQSERPRCPMTIRSGSPSPVIS